MKKFFQKKIAVLFILAMAVGIYFYQKPKAISLSEKTKSYSGSQSCKECHLQEFKEWENSHHALAERDILKNEGPDFKSFKIERVIGHEPIRQFLAKFPDGRYQALETTFDSQKGEWFNVFGSENRKPGEWGHHSGRGMNWNSMCASCHNTNLQKNYDERTDSYSTTMAERAVSCEACHGPLKEHGLWQESNKGKDPTLKKFTADQIIETCASCHSRRQDLTGKFKPGDSFHDHYKLSIVDTSDTFYPDGQVKGENYEYSSFLGSKMYEKGVRCIDCHNPHTGKTKLSGNNLCLQCHDGSDSLIPKIDPVKHSFHSDKNPGGQCINCHMPQTVYMQRDSRHDHGFTIPDPLLTKTQNIPNACNRCHQDKSADWAIKWTDKWYGKKMQRPSRLRAQIIAKARKGDPSKLLDLLNLSSSSYWKAATINLLAPYSQDFTVSEILNSSLKDPSPLVREKASAALGDNLKNILNDPIRSVRFNSQWSQRSTIDLNSPPGIELKENLDFNADQPIGRMQMGSFYLSRGNPLEAIKHYKKAIEWDPFSAPIHHDLAIILAGINQIQKATFHLRKASELEPEDADYKFKLGLALFELGENKQAVEEFKAATKLNPSFAKAWYNLGVALNILGEKKNALAALKKAQKLDPNDGNILDAIRQLR